MQLGSTVILRGVVTLIGLLVLALCAVGLPLAIMSEVEGDFDYGLIFAGLYVPAIPFFYALHQSLNLLSYIDKRQAFSDLSVNSLKKIKYCALIITGLFAASQPYVFYLADRDDAPGVAMIGFVIIGASFVVATVAALLERLVQHGVDLKSENDLTV